MTPWRVISMAWLVLVSGLTHAGPAEAQAAPAGFALSHYQAVERYLQQHPSLRDRTFRFQLRPQSPALPACTPGPAVQLLGKDRAWGAITLRLACEGAGAAWSRTVAAQVQVQGRVAVARHPLRAGEPIGEADVDWRLADLSRWNEPLVEASSSLEGMALARPVSQGAPIRLNDLRGIAVIRVGDLVSLGIKGRGFEIVTSGHALGDAALGASVRVKTLDGKILQGKAVSAGKIEASLD